MNPIGGHRNYGYGKQLAWAGKNALANRYGDGHYGTKATLEGRWNQFARYAKARGIKDARYIDKPVIMEYGRYLNDRVTSEQLSVAYAQNLLSTVNVVLATMRQDTALTVSPAALVGNTAGSVDSVKGKMVSESRVYHRHTNQD